VAPWSKEKSLPLFRNEGEASGIVARLQPGVIAMLETCTGTWCKLSGDGFEGWMQQTNLWGAYPGERLR
jgi:SH3-like domain-containing protein